MTDPNVAQWFTEMKRVQTVEFREPQFDAYDRRSPKAPWFVDELLERVDE